MDEQLVSAVQLTIYDSTPTRFEAEPGDEWARLYVGGEGRFTHANGEIACTYDALKKLVDGGAAALRVLDLPDPEEDQSSKEAEIPRRTTKASLGARIWRVLKERIR